ncbi:MAG TPA: D-amino acid aminotransferase [Steroidobacteraceae bacterium]|nr:D-amino acid aminotransferase [Steroidobacteraceae bacterium]
MADPFPTCYLNGEYLPLSQARISPLDRGFLYGDGAYEVIPVYGGRPFRLEAHCARLTRSLGEIRMEDPHSRAEWCDIFATLIARNGASDQYIYWQVTRGAERGRNHAPLPDIPRTIFAFCAPLPVASPAVLEKGVSCVTADDTRWARCDIKSVALLANVLLRQLAVDADAAETILIRNRELMEASASTVYAVINGELRTPPNSRKILPGTTRGAVEELAARTGVPCRATTISEAELRGADEIWISAATREVQPVTTLDGKPVGTGRPGPLWRRVYDEFQRWKQELQHQPWR